jgi:hypothetical protein
MSKALMTRKAVELMGAIGDWLGGVVFTAAVGGIAAWYVWDSRKVRDGRRY